MTANQPPQTAPALATAGLSHAFGSRKALDDVSIAIAPGEFAVLLGPNGAGKTTLFALATRLYNSQAGAIRVFGRDLAREPGVALARIGAIFQQPTLDLDLSVRQNLFYHASLHGIARREAEPRMTTELARIGMAERGGDKVRQLSAGQRRRVEVARALLHRPDLMLLDEPTVGLDVASRQYLLDHLQCLCREQRLAVLWATHLIDEAERDATVIVLHQGKILAHGTADSIVAATGAASLKEAFQRLTAGNQP